MSMALLIQAAKEFQARTGIPERFAAAWMAAENGYGWYWTNNPANISYEGPGVPSSGVFYGVTRVLPNRVVVYDDVKDGVDAWANEINMPMGPNKWLTLDTKTLLSCGDVLSMCKRLGESNWAESHYVGQFHKWAGGSVWEAYNSTVLTAYYGPVSGRQGGPDVKYDELPVVGINSPHTGCVKAIQAVVGVKPDGDFGQITHEAVASWQKAHGLQSDGVVGDKTWQKILS